jgi:hypothetical protein
MNNDAIITIAGAKVQINLHPHKKQGRFPWKPPYILM